MKSLSRYLLFLFFIPICSSCFFHESSANISDQRSREDMIITGAERTALYLPLLRGKNVAIVANQTSIIGRKHLVDSLFTLGVQINKIFCPEHGFRGDFDAGERVANSIDMQTGIALVSLYGERKKPSAEDLAGIDIVLFDIQDVGARFYTFISTMHYVMEACAENGIDFLVLDRPNPNGYYIDGPILEFDCRSFVGMHSVPIVHGMTIAEYAQMINGEAWLENGTKCNLKWISCKNYSHSGLYHLPVNPSPNLQNMRAIYLYPSICLFEGTSMSVGRGTEMPFQVFGSPFMKKSDIRFTPVSILGVAKDPKYNGVLCKGIDLRNLSIEDLRDKKLNLEWLIYAYKHCSDTIKFFIPFFNNLAGNKVLKDQIKLGMSESEIKATWKPGLDAFNEIRKKYLLYEDFE